MDWTGAIMKGFNFKKEKALVLIYMVILIAGMFFSFKQEAKVKKVFAMPLTKKVILIDPGHGGYDPGKVSDSDLYEKDINLKIALKLQSYFEQSDCIVLLTRSEDEALGDRKNADLTARTDLANTSDADIAISIHQNSFTKKSAKGSQVFYYKNSKESQMLAKNIQSNMKEFLSQSNNRIEKADDTYFILKKTDIPAVIVECGFLSNPEETQLLTNEDYLEKLSWSIYLGVIDYFAEIDSETD